MSSHISPLCLLVTASFSGLLFSRGDQGFPRSSRQTTCQLGNPCRRRALLPRALGTVLGALSFPVLGWVTLAVQSWATCLPGARRWLAFLTTEDRGQMPFLRRKSGGPPIRWAKTADVPCSPLIPFGFCGFPRVRGLSCHS